MAPTASSLARPLTAQSPEGPGLLCGLLVFRPLEHCFGSLPPFHRYRCPGRNGRQDAIAVAGAGRAFQAPLAHPLGHPRGHAAQPCPGRRGGRLGHGHRGSDRDALGARPVLHRHGRLDADSRPTRR